MAGAQVKFTGLVVARRVYRDADLIVKILTDEFGMRTFICHRARKPGYQFAAGILPFTQAKYWGTIKDGFSFLTSVRDAKQYMHIADDLMANAYATYILSLIDLAFEDGQVITRWYHFAKRALQHIDAGVDPQIVANIAEIQLLSAFGVEPRWQGCVECGRNDLPLDFSELFGGVLCQNHWDKDPRRFHVSARSMYYLRLFSTVDIAKLGKVNVAAATKVELQRVINQIYEDMVGATPRAKRFLNQMLGGRDKLQPLKPRTETH